MNLASQFPEEFRRVAQKAWTDEQFKSLLLRDPIEAVRQEGIEVPQLVQDCGVSFRVVEDTEMVRHIVLPPPPCDELSDLELATVAGGKGGGGGGRGGGKAGSGGEEIAEEPQIVTGRN